MSPIAVPQRKRFQRVILDCTHTHHCRFNTGIQRVVRRLTAESVAVAKKLGVECYSVYREGDAFYQTNLSYNVVEPTSSVWKEKLWKRYASIMGPALGVLPWKKPKKWLVPEPGHRGIFKLFDKLQQRFAVPRQKPNPRIEIGPGDLFMLTDIQGYTNPGKVLSEVHESGAVIGAVVYDLIPFSHPHCFHPSLVDTFHPWFWNMVEHADFFLAISKTVRDELVEFLANSDVTRRWNRDCFGSFRLGADKSIAKSTGTVRTSVKQYFEQDGNQPVYLLVSTIEPRKNHQYLLDAFDIAWRQGTQAKLCIVGRIGWLNDDIMTRLDRHRLRGTKLECFHDLSDVELDYVYKRSNTLIYPSIKEGFGLPLIEALRNGLRVLASDIPIHREVGQDFCSYFDLNDPQSLVTMIRTLDENPSALRDKNPAKYPMASWRDSCHEFLHACLEYGQNAAQESTVPQLRRGERTRIAA